LNIKEAALITEVTSKDLADLIIDSIQDIKGKGIIKMDLTHLDHAPTDYFIICEGDSSTQIRGISNNINKRVKEELGLRPNHSEGITNSNWILVDYFDIVVHIFYPETRAFYDLENLWSDAEVERFKDID